MYQVMEYFTDLHDADHEYHPGDIFPPRGYFGVRGALERTVRIRQ